MFNNRYGNQNHAVHRTSTGLDKSASIYDEQAVSNRVKEEKPLTFSSLAPFESEAILSVMQKEAASLEESEIRKEAAFTTTPFDHFKTAKNYISSKLGIGDDTAHDLASGILGRAHELQNDVGGDIEPIISGIVDNIDVNEIHERIGAIPMRNISTQHIEENVKMRLMQEMQLSAFQADQITKSVMQQSRNLSTRFRQASTEQIADAIVNVIVNYQDTSIVYSISSTSHLLNEVEQLLNNA